MFGPSKANRALQEQVFQLEAVVAAIHRSQAVIEFALDGAILDANENFLQVLGYRLEEVKGRQHNMFVDPAFARSDAYQDFWKRLRGGEFLAQKFERLGKGGKRVVIEASYNPIFDADGKPFKVVKFAIDVTAVEVERERQEAERKRASEELADVVERTADALSQLSEGDLTVRLGADFPADYVRLGEDFNAAVSRLETVVGEISTHASTIHTGAAEISQAADDLSRRTEQQAASLEETAAALDEITATVNRTAEGAQRAGASVTSAREEAERSGEVVNRAVAAMDDIERSAGQISQIIGVIDEIAFQTNLLALNAGVEAARAGDAGRGFAVVASEVRALAQRSAEAAKEIKTLISASSAQVATGVGLVGQTGKALQAIIQGVSGIHQLMSEITASAQEQATGLQQVNTAVNQMDQVTQQNAAMVEQSTAASHGLSRDSQQLAGLVSRFKTADAPVADAPAERRPAARPAFHDVQKQRIARFARVGASGSNLALAEPANGWEEF
ncbi:MAG: PAS domain S-box protein [Brevundimonas sp.]|nr:PAS domain S-box protein [Brevundimonas sp.]